MTIKYNHSKNRHSLKGPAAFLPVAFEDINLNSLLDVGCGIGTWTKAAMDLGLKDVFGIDGVKVSSHDLLIPAEKFMMQDFTQDWNLGRRFDLALCLEVGEHLQEQYASRLVRCLARHSDTVVFSAACPGQAGEHHVNCQWPAFWQNLFNQEGFCCDDSLRWKVWDDCRIEPWYRQNVFVAVKDPQRAGRDRRLKPVVHPEFLYGTEYEVVQNARFSSMNAIEGGGMTVGWYLRTPLLGLTAKLGKRMRASNRA